MINAEKLMASLKVNKYPKCFDDLYSQAMVKYEEVGCLIADEDYLKALNGEFQIFKRWFNEILQAALYIRENTNLLKFVYLLKHAMADFDNASIMLSELQLPVCSDNTLASDLAPIFSILPYIPDTVKQMKARNLPYEIIRDTLKGYEHCIDTHFSIYGRPSVNIRFLNWLKFYIHSKIIRVGRLEFEIKDRFDSTVTVFKNKNNECKMLLNKGYIHREGNFLGNAGYEDDEESYLAELIETSQYYEGYKMGEDGLAEKKLIRLFKDEWEIALSSDDTVISVHIPSDSGGLNPKLCEESYDRAREIYKNNYPEINYKAFTCFSWLMDPQLKKLLGQKSNIVIFQDKYMKFTRPSKGNEIFNFIFLKAQGDLKLMTENTKLERAIKNHYLSGNYIYSFGGLFF